VMSGTIKLYNTMSRKLEELESPTDQPLKIYTCGLTVYAQAHIGNWRKYIFDDTLIRTLKYFGYTVERSMNHTDVGHLVSNDDEGADKLQKAANSQRKTAWEIAESYIELFESEFREFGLLWPDYLVRATKTIDQQIAMVQNLEDLGFAYLIDDGVYFDTSKLTDYGKLARLDADNLQAGARIALNKQKRNVTDFALWKLSPKDEQRDMEWDSPWGVGFPGWHIECSAIAEHTLGAHIDIHTGGIDHVAVHHTNEIAQSEAVYGAPFSRFWLHNEHMMVEGEKMAKSKGNGFTLSDLRDRGFSPEDFRILMLQSHYRSQTNFTWQAMNDAQQIRLRLYNLAARQFQLSKDLNETSVKQGVFDNFKTKLTIALTNDLNTPQALAAVLELVKKLESSPIHKQDNDKLSGVLTDIEAVFGIQLANAKDIVSDVYALIEKRHQARAAQDYDLADKLRTQLAEQNVQVRDTGWGSVWEYVKSPELI